MVMESDACDHAATGQSMARARAGRARRSFMRIPSAVASSPETPNAVQMQGNLPSSDYPPSSSNTRRARPRGTGNGTLRRAAMAARRAARSLLLPWLAISIHGDRLAWRRRHLHMVVDAAKVVDDVVVLRRTAGGRFAATHVAPRSGITNPVDIGAQCRSAHGTADGRHGIAGAAADLMAEDAAEDAADDGAGHVRVVALVDLLSLSPAALLGRTDHRAHGSDRRLEHAFVRALPVFVGGCGERLRRL